MPLLSIIIPSYKDIPILAKSLPLVFSACQNMDVEIVLINDDPKTELNYWLALNYPTQATVISHTENRGFAAALNTGLASTSGEFVFFANSDLFITSDYIKDLLNFMQTHPQAASVTGKLLRYNLQTDQRLTVIDTTGCIIFRNRRFMDRGEGEKDLGQYQATEQVFCISGAAWFGRRSALLHIAVNNKVFDENFFMYKEDLDVGWRLRLQGWENWYFSDAVAYHGRTSRSPGQQSYLQSIGKFWANERHKSAYIRLHSIKNQWFMYVKNETCWWFGSALPAVLARELIVILFNLLFSPRLFVHSVTLFFNAFTSESISRNNIQQTRKVSEDWLKQWYADS